MQKIPTLFVRDYTTPRRPVLTDQVTPGCEWVLAGEGTATRKYDGTCVMLDPDGTWWARREVKQGKTPPPGFRPLATDEETGKTVGWEPIEQSSFIKAFREALEPLEEFGALIGKTPPAGTYELIGPKVNGNPERASAHQLQRHATAEQITFDGTLTFDGIRATVRQMHCDAGWEGIVWHHQDGRMAKIKARDFH